MDWAREYLALRPAQRRAVYRHWVRESRRLGDPIRMTFTQFERWVRQVAGIARAPAGPLAL